MTWRSKATPEKHPDYFRPSVENFFNKYQFGNYLEGIRNAKDQIFFRSILVTYHIFYL